MSTMIFEKAKILQLCKIDSELIIRSYSVSDVLGREAVSNSIELFTELLIKQKGKIVPSLDLDYRFYIIELLNIVMTSTSEDLKAKIFSDIVLPKSAKNHIRSDKWNIL